MSQQTFINEFQDGLNKDVDLTRVKNSFLRDALNVRLIEVDGQGFVATNENGNELKFSLSPGFLPLGYAQYNGIAYILSYNPTTGDGEAGTYPSPNYVTCAGGFNMVYAPLMNFTGPVNPNTTTNPTRFPFRTPKFNFDCEHQISVVVRDDFDNSVNIYFADWKNPISSINSGFDQTGKCNNRYLWDGSFPNQVSLLNETCMHAFVTLQSITDGGDLKCGNYFFFFRYNTTDFNPTSFFGQTSAIQISPDDNQVQGITVDGRDGSISGNKCANIRLDNVDTTYPYIEVAFVRYADGLTTSGLVDKLYDVVAGQTFLEISICGTEEDIDFTLAEIEKKKPKTDVARAITQFENRLWGVNTKQSVASFHPDFIAFANAINIKYDDTKTVIDAPFATGQDASVNGQYKDYQKTHDFVGYFRGETYPFGIVFVFKNGRESVAFPLKGKDDWNNLGTNVNNDGIYRFPNNTISSFKEDTVVNGDLKIMGVKFDVNTAFSTIFDSSTFLQDNICGYYFVRGERNPNLVYQGVSVGCWNAPAGDFPDRDDFGVHCDVATGAVVETQNSLNFIPIVDGLFPFLDHCFEDVTGPNNVDTTTVYFQQLYQKADKFGIHSPDHFFKKTINNKEYTVIRVGSITFSTSYPTGYLSKRHEVSSIAFTGAIQKNTSSIANIKGFEPSDFNGFVSYFFEGNTGCSQCMLYRKQIAGGIGDDSFETHQNLQSAVDTYIALDQAASAVKLSFTNSVISIYDSDPDDVSYDITKLYQTKNVSYFKISNFIDAATSPATVSALVHYRGDCFLQRTYLKEQQNPNHYPTTLTDSGGVQYSHGSVLAIVTENVYNTAMRYQDITRKYYPETGLSNTIGFTVNYIFPEADFFNLGYNRSTSDVIVFAGFDTNAPIASERYPTRMIYSNVHVPNSFQDGYRQIDVAAYRDYDYRLGEMVNVIDVFGKLTTVQESGVNIHYVNERAVLDSQTSGEFVIGNGEILSQKALTVSDQVGSQHQWSIIKASTGLYGVDFNKRKIWNLGQDGAFRLISDEHFIRQFMHDVADSYDVDTDITAKLPDNPVCNVGIVAGYDRKYSDIIFTFYFGTEQEINTKTISFNEWLKAFTTLHSYKPPFYLSINDDFHSINPASKGDFYRHDVEEIATIPNRCNFYGTQYPWYIDFVVNPTPEIAKVFDNVDIVSNGEPFEQIKYSTEDQTATQNPFIDPSKPWINPKFSENRWRLPITRADATNATPNNVYQTASRLRGKFVRIYLEYLQNKPIFVKSVLSYFRNSKS